MRHLLAIFVAATVVCVAMVSPPVRSAAADGSSPPAPAPTPAPTPAPPRPADCAACLQCVGACTSAYADCTRKCFAQPDLPSQQACVALCPSVAQCAQSCPCSGCVGMPGLPSLPH